MNWKVKISSKAEKYYLSLPPKTKKKVKEKLKELEGEKYPLFYPDVKPLTGKLKGFHRLRTGKFRVIFYLIEEEKIIAVVNIYPRGNIYKKK